MTNLKLVEENRSQYELLSLPGKLSFQWKENSLFVTFFDAKTKNSISLETAFRLAQLFQTSEQANNFVTCTRTVQIVLNSGIDGVFVSGGNLTEILQSNRATSLEMCEKMRNFCKCLGEIPARSVCLLQGLAAGGGSELALACDEIWLVGSSGKLAFWQSKFGVPPGWNGFAKMAMKVGQRQASYLCAAACSIDCEEMLRLNFASKSFESFAAAENELKISGKALSHCPVTLLEDLYRAPDTLEVAFNKHWMTDYHQKKLEAFQKKTEGNSL